MGKLNLSVATIIDEATGSFMTPKGRLTYAQTLVTGKENDHGVVKYNCNLLFPPESDFKVLKKAMMVIALKETDGNKKMALKLVEARFLDPNDLPSGGKPAGPEFEGWITLRMASNHRPDFVFPNGQPMTSDQAKGEIYSGRWARASCNPYYFKTKDGTNKGVTVGLQNVQLLDHDNNLGGGKPSADGQFGKVSDEGASQTSDGSVDDTEPAVSEEEIDALFD